ncbi:MAG TPA: L,D-transpeptidase, partial [Polyangiaceae bacterium]|nr:L,D-transpeptidase [Polyangiaceae bacterium]
GEGCAEGWYRLAPYGFVCGRNVTLDANHPEARARTPNLDDPLPYPYAHNLSHGTPLYKSLPTRDEMASYEPYLGITPSSEPAARRASRERDDERSSGSKRRRRREREREREEAAAKAEAEETTVGLPFGGGFSPAPPEGAGGAPGYDPSKPWWAQTGKGVKPEVTLADLLSDADDVLAKRMVRGFYVSVDHTFTHESRPFHKTLSGLLAPADRMGMVKAPSLSGQAIDEAHAGHAVAFVLAKEASKYEADVDKKTVRPAGPLARYDRAFLTGKTLSVGGKIYRETTDGHWLRGVDVAFTQPGAPPVDLAPGEKWVDVNLARQTLVAFEGTRPVFATLVSTGRKGPDKEHDHKTPTGTWRIREKHVAATMDGDGAVAGDLPYSIEDVPFIMYYFESYALHGAFWHDNFGRQQSHGCVNLAPADAKRLFLWTDPPLPAGWHGVQSTAERPGSRVVVHELGGDAPRAIEQPQPLVAPAGGLVGAEVRGRDEGEKGAGPRAQLGVAGRAPGALDEHAPRGVERGARGAAGARGDEGADVAVGLAERGVEGERGLDVGDGALEALAAGEAGAVGDAGARPEQAGEGAVVAEGERAQRERRRGGEGAAGRCGGGGAGEGGPAREGGEGEGRGEGGGRGGAGPHSTSRSTKRPGSTREPSGVHSP